MTFNTKEQQIIKWAAENGKTRFETEQALFRYRTTGNPSELGKIITPKPIQNEGFLKELGGDIKETAKGISSEIMGAGERITKRFPEPEKTGFLERAVGVGAETFRGVSRAFGEGIVGVGKMVLPQQTEERIGKFATNVAGKIGSTEFAQDLMKKYESLSPAQKQGVDDVLGFAGGLADLVALGSARATKPILNKAKGLVEEGLRKTALEVEQLPKTVSENTLNKIRGYANVKQRADISKQIDELLTSTKGIQNKVKLAQQKRNIDFGEFLKEPQIFKGIKVSKGKVLPDDAIKTLDSRIETVLDAKRKMLPEIDRIVPEVSRDILRRNSISKLKGTPADNAKIIKRIDEQLKSLPETLTPSKIDELRAIFRKSARTAQGLQKEGSHYSALENGFRDTMFNITDNLPVANASEFANLNTYIKDLIGTKDFLDKTLRGQILKGGKLGTYTGRLIGAVAGAKGGVLGALAGSEIGGAISNILVNNQLGSSMKMRLIKGMTKDPKILSEVERLLKDVQDFTPLALPEGGKFRTVVPSGKTIKSIPRGRDIEVLKGEATQLSDIPKISRQKTANKTIIKNSIPKTTTKKKLKSSKSNVTSLQQETKKLKSIDELYDKFQKEIDDLIDKKMAIGMSFEQADNSKDVLALYEKRFAVEDIEIQRLRKDLFEDLPLSNKMKKDLIEREFGLREKGTILKISGDNIRNFLKKETTPQNLINDILSERGLSPSIFKESVSGLTETGRKALVKEMKKIVDETFNVIENSLNKPSHKITKSQLKDIWEKAHKK